MRRLYILITTVKYKHIAMSNCSLKDVTSHDRRDSVFKVILSLKGEIHESDIFSLP